MKTLRIESKASQNSARAGQLEAWLEMIINSKTTADLKQQKDWVVQRLEEEGLLATL